MLAGCNRVSEEARDEREREFIYREEDLGWEDYGLEFCRVLI
jgi:hypothetical protein